MKSTAVFASLSKVEDNDDGTITVTGIASTGNPDNEGETVTPQAMQDALPDYMMFGAIREMHQANVAAGTALSAKVDDDGVTHLSALIVDEDAIKKVKTGVYKGFSVGGKVLERDPLDKTVITGIKLTEVSLVDRPCNPEAVINMWKVDMSDKTAAGATPANQAEGAVDALAELINKGDVSVERLLELAKADKEKADPVDPKKAKKADGSAAETDGDSADKDNQAEKAEGAGKESTAAVEADKKGTPDEATKVAKADGGGTVQNDSDVAPGKNADTPMLPSPKIGDLVDFTWGQTTVQGVIREIGESDIKVSDTDVGPMLAISAAKFTHKAADTAGVNSWSVNSETKEVAVSKAAGTEDLTKGMWTVSDFARLLQEVLYLQNSVQWEQDQEKDGSTMAGQIAAWGKQGAALLLAYVQEEAAEMFSGIDDPDNVESVIVELAAKSTKLGKADAARWAVMAAGADDLAKAGARHSKADMEHMQSAHDALCKLGVACSKDNVAKEDGGEEDMSEVQKAMQAGDLAKAHKLLKQETMADTEALIKAAVTGQALKSATALKKVQDENANLRERLEKMEKQPDPSQKQPVHRVVEKGQDDGLAHLEKADKDAVVPVKTSTGEADPVATALKKSQQSGGISFTHRGLQQ
jgi:hypothetical protein